MLFRGGGEVVGGGWCGGRGEWLGEGGKEGGWRGDCESGSGRGVSGKLEGIELISARTIRSALVGEEEGDG